jgi:two-component system NtrC family sensor kinase
LSQEAAQEFQPLVLVVDDDAHLRSLLRRILEKQGYRVAEAENGAECLRAFEQLKPDIILMDVMMPVMDGFNACVRLRGAPGGNTVPIVMVTVLDDYRSVNRAFEAGATDYMTKPLNTQVLTNRLRYMLSAAKTERLVTRAKNEWEATFDAVSDLIVITDLDGRIIRCNRATVDRLHTTFKEVIGRPIEEVILGDAELDDQGARVVTGEVQLPLLGGYFDISTYTVHVEESLYGRVYVIQDITARKQMEMRMLASQKLADLGTLAAGVAHEINSPLQVITGVSRSLLDRHDCGALDSERLRKGLTTIHRNGWRCAEIVRALRTYAHAAATDIKPNDLNAVVRDTLLLIENQLRSWSNVTVVTELASGLPTLQCDRNQITQLLINLLTNARDAMPSGGQVTIRTGFAAESRRLTLSVSDTGVGISESNKAKIFDPFFTTKPPGQGTGLGLSIVAGVVRAHGGEVKVDSTAGKGTVFTISLPEVAAPPDEPLPEFDASFDAIASL